ncbi:hypothetical protein ACQUSR_02315 [Streptomyces sp. P1-3]|uniref:hypothetical protein n=1 Tax=Streptomyces sp. P1-3 TaxID=3421658 RepID=UPI003D36F8A4
MPASIHIETARPHSGSTARPNSDVRQKVPGIGRHRVPEQHPHVDTPHLGRLRDPPPQARRGRVTLNLYDQLSAYLPRRPGAYLRISSDRFGLEAGVDRQLEDAEDTRAFTAR